MPVVYIFGSNTLREQVEWYACIADSAIKSASAMLINDCLCLWTTGGEHQHEMQCTLQGVPAVQPIRLLKATHTASHLEQKLSLHPTGVDKKPIARNTVSAASHLEARNTLHPM